MRRAAAAVLGLYISVMVVAGATWIARETVPWAGRQICSIPHASNSICGWTMDGERR